MKKTTLQIDGRKVSVPEGTTILQAARDLGIDIPTLCHHEELLPYGACRLCMVEISRDKGGRLVASCVYPVEEGLKIKTDTTRVKKVRKMILELLLPTAPVGPLKSLASEYGIEKSRFTPEEQPTFCTLCGLCVRYCNEIVRKDAVGFVGRGVDREVSLLPGKDDICVLCRKCYDLCEAGRFPIIAER
jgi:NADH dehydrogenase/NADH:ubiquinone oxidoreductase subunit G